MKLGMMVQIFDMDGERKLTSAEWQKLYPNQVVFDPAGWDRSNYDYSWNVEQITLEEYKNRLVRSTVIHLNKPIDCNHDLT